MREWPEPKWLGELPEAAGAFTRNVSLADYTTAAVGGPAEVFATVNGWDGMAALVKWCNAHAVPLTLIGKGSNMVIRDGGIPGIVAHLAKGFDAIDVDDLMITAEAGAACGTVARAAREAGLEGMAFFAGIPGSVGGALRMNAGAYGHETYARMTALWLIDAAGDVQEVEPDFVAPRYRGTALPEGWIYKAAAWELVRGNKDEINRQMQEINRERSASQPLHLPSSGSWFKNVRQGDETLSAWKLVEDAGCRTLRVGGAMVSAEHANFFVNIGATEKGGTSATAADFEVLSERIEEAVREKTGITLEREVRFAGV